MKPTDRRHTEPADTKEAWPLEHPPSELAEPAITVKEARAAEHATCRWHRGRIAHSPVTSDTEGKVYWCPIGRQFWRYSKLLNGFLEPLHYPRDQLTRAVR